MTVEIMQLQADAAGNLGWVWTERVDLIMEEVENFIQLKFDSDGKAYAAETTIGAITYRLAEVGV